MTFKLGKQPEVLSGDFTNKVDEHQTDLRQSDSGEEAFLKREQPLGPAINEIEEEPSVASEEHDCLEVSKDNPNEYVMPQYFVQRYNRFDFTYPYLDKNGEEKEIVFTGGQYITKDVKIATMLRNDILRPGGIGHLIEDITEEQFRKWKAGADQYAHIRAKSGFFNAKDAKVSAQVARIKELENKIKALGGEV